MPDLLGVGAQPIVTDVFLERLAGKFLLGPTRLLGEGPQGFGEFFRESEIHRHPRMVPILVPLCREGCVGHHPGTLGPRRC